MKRRRLEARAPPEVLSTLPASLPCPAPRAVSSGSPPAPGGKPSRWPTRLRRELAAADRPDLLAQAEERDRDRWVLEAVEIFTRDEWPIAGIAEGAVDPQAVLRRSLGGRRARTLRARVRTWRRVRAWLVAAGYCPCPQGLAGARHIVEYLCELAGGACARTVPRAILSALQFIEQCGAVDKSNRVSEHALVTSTVKDLERELALGSTRQRRKAPQYPISVLIALECTVMDKSFLPYKRVFCWWKLVRVWGSMRFDDILHVRPDGVVLDSAGLSLTAHSTKTTGAGKRVEQVFAFVSPQAFFLFRDWAKVGYNLLGKIAGHVKRDYLLPLPSPDFQGVRRGPVLYADALNMTRTMLRELLVYQLVAGKSPKAIVPAETLLHADAAVFWSEHSDRAQLISWAACCKVEQSAMDALGRWRAGCSSEYIRTSRSLVVSAQGTIAKSLWRCRASADLFGEEALFLSLRSHLDARSWSRSLVDQQVERLRFFAGSHEDRELNLVVGKPLSEPSVPLEEAHCGGPDPSPVGPYVVSISTRTKVRCLGGRGFSVYQGLSSMLAFGRRDQARARLIQGWRGD